MVIMANCRYTLSSLTLALVFAGIGSAKAGEWRVTPRVVAQTDYTDNLFLEDEDQESDFIFSVNPGVKVSGRGRRFKLDLDYSLENLLYASNSEFNATNHQLHTDGKMELVEDYFYLDALADVGQRSASINGQRPIDNISVTDNRVDYEYYRVSPYFRHDFSGVMNSNVRYSANRYSDDYGDTSADPAASDTSDNNSEGWDASLTSGREFTRLTWGLFYNYYQQDQARGLDQNADPTVGEDKRESANADFSYAFSENWSGLLRGGYEENDIGGQERSDNGSYTSAGIGWRPNRKFGLRVYGGSRDKEVALELNPTVRTDIDLSWRNMDVGTVTGPSWELRAEHRTRLTTWRANYEESLVSQQELILAGYQPILVTDPTTGRPIVLPQPFYSLDDENFLRKYGDVGMRYVLGRNNYYVRLFHEDRAYTLESDRDEVLYGFNAGVDFSLAAYSTLGLEAQWDRRNFQNIDRDEDFYTLRTFWERQLSPEARFELSYAHTMRNTDGTEQNSFTGGDLDYDENRVMARLTKEF